ncbi:MAG: SDR family oxidoreductase, partial [Brevundimonas sp.]
MSSAIFPSLKGRVVVVTGGGSGIGGALTEGFARQGAKVVFLDVAEEESRALEASLASLDPAPKFVKCDLTDLQAVKAVFAEIAAFHGDVEVLVNNAANDDRHSLGDVTPE